jgi:hypothetical protein
MTHITYQRFVDNRNANHLAHAVRQAWQEIHQAGLAVEELCIATGFFNLGGFRLLADVLHQVPRTRLLLGVEPRPEAERPQPRPGENIEELWRRLLQEQLKWQDQGLRQQRDLLPFDREEEEAVRRLLQWLYSGKIEVRRHMKRILHAKVYLFRCANAGAWVGSSNFTYGGLVGNLELNLGHDDPALVAQIGQWFNELWQEAEPFNLAELYDRLMEEYPPFLIYLRMLYELYGEQWQEEQTQEVIPLSTFQKHGVWRAMKIMDRFGGVLVADGVGLGKTYVAGEIARRFIDRRQRVLLICPAALRDTTWKRFLNEYQLFAEVVSFEQLGEEQQLGGRQTYLNRAAEEYALVIVDEAHHYRNPGTPKRAITLQRLLRKARYPKVLLLTATPVNNSLWDLYYLLRFFLRQDAALSDRGIVSIRRRFEQAMVIDPFDLEPDLLFPILDATTVKRTRGFIKREYPNEQIQLENGQRVLIQFPKPVLQTIRYQMTPVLTKLLGELEACLAPVSGPPGLTLARYQPEQYLLPQYRPHDLPSENPVVGLLRSALLKRFESSVGAFRQTLKRMIQEHELFLEGLTQGFVVGKELLKEISAAGDEVDDESLNQIIADSPYKDSSSRYNARALERDVTQDLDVLKRWLGNVEKVAPHDDPKLKKLADVLAEIAGQAGKQSVDDADERRKRKVIVFSGFEDTIDWIEDFLEKQLQQDGRLRAYQGRMVSVSGDKDRHNIPRNQAIKEFAPSAAAPHENAQDRYDLLLSTDVISEGMNLQDCRNIVNFDLPWNPMRLVQRHGRVDRITSPHREIYLRSFFPAEELKKLLDLDERIRRKLAQAAATVGIETPPIERSPQADRSFAESRREIERILQEKPDLLEEGARPSAALSSEEYRMKLQKNLQKYGAEIETMPWKAGSGMVSPHGPGYVFLARVGLPDSPESRVFMRFVPSAEGPVIREMGTCLRLVQCEEATPRELPDHVRLAAFDAWRRAHEDIWQEWMESTDPKNLQPRLRPLHHRVAEFLRRTPPAGDPKDLDALLNRVLSPWSVAMEREIRAIFEDPDLENRPQEKARRLAEKIDELGIEPFHPPPPLPPIHHSEIHLVCWLALIKPEA